MSQMLRVVVGHGTYAPGAHAALAARLADHARAIGLTVRSIAASRVQCSSSRYLTIADTRGRMWIIRVSNHRKPDCTGHETPHLDLVSIDGIAGHDVGCGFLDRLRAGEVAWFDPAATVQRLRRRRG